MQHITGIARNQMIFTSFEERISEDNSVRFIDAFVENINLKALGFELQTLKMEGRPSFKYANISQNIFIWLSQWT
ncbi:hypothetical protein [Chryseobacterium salivictor]|uniref:hypothetical protein n=1 Tax=Chryseobacterium salivictor TaxID=2547600 RepID=UPI001FEABD83|nr:hypothetical protein [Chryseobacterium salivictor]